MINSRTYPCGYMTFGTEDKTRARPILLDIWYPAAPTAVERPVDYRPGAGMAAADAPPAKDKQPLVVLSHGAFGAARNYSWIAEKLARRGYVVAGVSHFGESFVYGPQTIDPSAALRPWHRPMDCSVSLDFLLAHPLFEGCIDHAAIGALGHSSGGATVIALAGAVFDPRAMRHYCQSDDAREDRGCGYGTSLPADARRRTESPPAEATALYRDERVRAVVALDPALGPGHDATSLSRVSIPVHIVGAVENDFLPYAHHSGRYARLIPGASLTPLAHGEGHFVFLNECTGDLEAQGNALCKDREGVQRSVVHALLEKTIGTFLAQHLAVA
jgi:predicted dienelactone hydrolase